MQIELEQNPKRYSYGDGVWKISAKKGLKPVEITEGDRSIDITPALSVGGVIVHIVGTDIYLGSEETVVALTDSFLTNPHYSYKEHSMVLGATMGKSIPILEVKTDSILQSIEKQKDKGKFAGVKEVKWSLDDDFKGLIEQINWTLSPTFNKPKDNYTIFDLNLLGDYSVAGLPITPLDDTKRIPEDVLASNLKIINDRIVQLRKDFTSITDTFYFGKVTPTSTTTYDIVSSTEGEEYGVQVVTKDSVMASKVATPASQLADEQSKAVDAVKADVQSTATSLSEKITNNEATIKSAQSGDAQAQSTLNAQLTESKSFLQRLRDKLKAANPTLDI
jgi:hypothetical protein